jgi:hypothetical protein
MTTGQLIALTIVVKALLATHPNKAAAVRAIKSLSDAGIRHADPKLQAQIDRSLLHWINSA